VFDDFDFALDFDFFGDIGNAAGEAWETVEAGDWMDSGEWEWEWVEEPIGEAAMDFEFDGLETIEPAAYELGATDIASYNPDALFDYGELGGDYYSLEDVSISPEDGVMAYLPGEEAAWPSWMNDVARFGVQTVGQVMSRTDSPQRRYMYGRQPIQPARGQSGGFFSSLFGGGAASGKGNDSSGLILAGVALLALAFVSK
jgi:hypothetical protein